MIEIPITTLYVAIHGLIILGMAVFVARRRGAAKISLGDGGNESLLAAMRVQGNYGEYAPIALMMILVLELMGGTPLLLHGLGIALTIGRLAHWQGLASSTGTSVGRAIGTSLTFLVILVGAVVCFMAI
jgi:uncharacterized membrane protein YecN with MAPEG domain